MTQPNGVLVVHTVTEAASILQVNESWLKRQAAARKIPFVMLGGCYRFTAEHLSEIVRLNEQIPSVNAGSSHSRRKPRAPQSSTASVSALRPRAARPRSRAA